MKATCFALVTVISSKVPSVKLSSCWWEIYSNLLRFSLHKWHNQADWCVAPQSAPQKWCVGVEWACPQRLSKGENVRPVVYANFFETMLPENKLWEEKNLIWMRKQSIKQQRQKMNYEESPSMVGCHWSEGKGGTHYKWHRWKSGGRCDLDAADFAHLPHSFTSPFSHGHRTIVVAVEVDPPLFTARSLSSPLEGASFSSIINWSLSLMMKKDDTAAKSNVKHAAMDSPFDSIRFEIESIITEQTNRVHGE